VGSNHSLFSLALGPAEQWQEKDSDCDDQYSRSDEGEGSFHFLPAYESIAANPHIRLD